VVKKAILICGWQDDFPPQFNGDYIGIDRGALLCALKGIDMVFAIGDFDSVEEHEKEKIRLFSDEMLLLDPIKDVSDTEAALVESIKRGYDEIVLWGALGGRFDHTLVNLKLAQRYACLRLLDAQNEVYTLGEGIHPFHPNEKPYISFFALEDSEISLVGFAYPLIHAFFTVDTTLGLSNRISAKKAQITVHKGKILVVRSIDK
jgi:thiamine pyrophosphokinase